MTRHHPLLVTMRLRDGLPSLRQTREYREVTDAFRKGCERFGFRLVHYSVMTNHIHMIVEGDERRSVSRGMQGLMIRIAKALNRIWERKGRVFSDRYHDRVLNRPAIVRNAIRYVLLNRNRHAGRPVFFGAEGRPDPGSSGAWFDGWREEVDPFPGCSKTSFLARAQSWLMNVGWKRYGRISMSEVPGPSS